MGSGRSDVRFLKKANDKEEQNKKVVTNLENYCVGSGPYFCYYEKRNFHKGLRRALQPGWSKLRPFTNRMMFLIAQPLFS
jgi:hypothetical protein